MTMLEGRETMAEGAGAGPEERTLIILKPDAVARGLVGRLLQRFEDKGLRFAGMKLVRASETLARAHYAEHEGKPFYPSLVTFLTSGPVLVLVVQGLRSVTVCRAMLGKTFGYESAPGTIRGDFGDSGSFNLVHGSDSPASAAREIGLWFAPGELVEIDRGLHRWVYSAADWSL